MKYAIEFANANTNLIANYCPLQMQMHYAINVLSQLKQNTIQTIIKLF